MKNNIEIERLKQIVSYLKRKPKVKCNPYPEYDVRIHELLSSLGTSRDYLSKHDDLVDKEINEYTLADLKVMYTFIVRGERFCDGHIMSYIEDGTLLKLANRHLEILKNK